MAPPAGGVPASAPVVAVAGSRRLPPAGRALVARVAQALVRSGHSLAVGCCVGADAAAIQAVPARALSIFAAFGPQGQGACQLSAVGAVELAARQGAAVTYWAGGGPKVPLRTRLARRSRAVVAAGPAGLVLFPGSPRARGSWLAADMAAGSFLPVVAFPVGFSPELLPSIGPGSWQPAASSGLWARAFRWVPSSLFDNQHQGCV